MDVDPVANMLGRVPLIPLFLAGNSTPTIPHKFSKHKGSAFPMGSADTARADGRRGSNVYEVNHWLWMFGPGAASPVWVVSQWRRLQSGKVLGTRIKSSVQ
jgi:hypothetical protein